MTNRRDILKGASLEPYWPQMAALGIPALAVATVGFSRTDMDLAVLAVPLSVIHALAMSVWIGGVVLLARVVLAGPGEEDLVQATRTFSRISVPAIVVNGNDACS